MTTIYTVAIEEHGVVAWDTVACSPLHAAEIAARVWGAGDVSVRDEHGHGTWLYYVYITPYGAVYTTYGGCRLPSGELLLPPLNTASREN